MSFKNMQPQRRKEVSQKGVNARRSPELQQAWLNQVILKERFNKGEGASKLAREHKINVRTLYRIVTGK